MENAKVSAIEVLPLAELIGDDSQDIIDDTINFNLLDGEKDQNLLDYRDSQTGVNIDLTTNTTDGGNPTGDSIGNIEPILGSNQGDPLIGDAQKNTIREFDGNDTLSGSLGRDTFTITSSSKSLFASFNTIVDLNTTEDSIDAPMEINGIDNFGTVNNLNALEITDSLSSLGADSVGILELNSRTFMAINDSNPGFDVAQDIFLEITGYTGDINNLEII